MFSAFRIFLLRCASVAVCEAHRLVRWSVGCYFHGLIFFVMYDKGINVFLIRCKYFVCFFCALCVIHCELSGKITAENAKVTQSTQVCLSKTFRPLNKSTFYIRLTALRRGGYSFSPTLRFATHWAELTCPCGAFTVVCYQFSSSQHSANNSTIQQFNNQTTQRPKGCF